MSFAQVKRVPEKGLHLLNYLFLWKDRSLLLERRTHPDYLRGRWNLPWDYLKYGEHPDRCTTRMIREHFGVKPKLSRLLFVLSYTRAHKMVPVFPRHWDLCFIYKAQVDKELGLNEKIISKVRYYSVENLPTELSPWDRYLIRRTIPSLLSNSGPN